MQPLQPYYIAGSKSGFINYQKPFLTPNDAYQTLENALVYRDRVIERPGLKFFGRLRRILTNQGAGNITAGGSGTVIVNLLTNLKAVVVPPGTPAIISASEINAELAPGTSSPMTIAIGNGQTLTSSLANGTLTVNGAGDITAASINYTTWALSVTTSGALGPTSITVTLAYYPGLPVMGIYSVETANIDEEQTIIFDTVYAYKSTSGANDSFVEYISGVNEVTWGGTDHDFFTVVNYKGSDASKRIFFVSNNVADTADPIRYSDGTMWTSFIPRLDSAPPAANFMYQAKILVVYYGRLVALGPTEGQGVIDPMTGLPIPGNPAGASYFFNRAQFSQIGDPTDPLAWRIDLFGRGGFIDAPTDESIVSAKFYKNTLIVGFEHSTWQLRYVGEYGLPFIWERISSDFGCESTFSPVLFDQGVLQVGDRAIVSATATSVNRIDDQIPDIVFSFKTDTFGNARVCGLRDFQNELVYWCWINTALPRAQGTYVFPNSTLVYNYRNNSYAVWRNNVTFFGIFRNPQARSWSDTSAGWNDNNILWSNAGNPDFPNVISGNQEGFISYFSKSLLTGVSLDDPTLSIHAVDLSLVPCQLTVPNHNLATGDWIRITSALFTSIMFNPPDPGLNGNIFQANFVDKDTIALYQWNVALQSFIAVNFSASDAVYQGLGQIAFYPVLNIVSKDFNPYQEMGAQVKLSYIDFLVDSQPSGQFSVNLYVNTNFGDSANIITGNKSLESWYQLFGNIIALAIDNTNTVPCTITSPNHGLRTGQSVDIENVTGTTQLNGNVYVVTYINSNTFSITADQSGFSPYLGGGDWLCQQQDLQAFGSDYAWHRFFATTTGQFVTYQITYNNDQMSTLGTQFNTLVLNAVSLYTRPGSRNVTR